MQSIVRLLWMLLLVVGASLLHARNSLRTQSADVDTQCRQWVDAVLSGLTLQEKVGQLIVATMPVEADKASKKQLRVWVKKYKIGGLLFSEGTPEEQTILANIARKEAGVPVIFAFEGEWGATMRLKDTPEYPDRVALGCIGDKAMVAAYEHEANRSLRALGIHADFSSDADAAANPLKPLMHIRPLGENAYRPVDKLLAGNDMVRVETDVQNAVHDLMTAVGTGRLSKTELETKCRKVLTYKYMSGLRSRQPQMQVSGMNYRIDTEEARALATGLRHSAVTVLNNYFNILPMTSATGDMAILSMGGQGADAPFVERMKQHAGIDHFHLSWNADEAARQEVEARLSAYRRVVISIAASTYIGDRDVAFLANLRVKAPLVYTLFTSHRMLGHLAPAVAKSSAVVLAHSAEAGLQQHVADVLFAKETANGRIPVDIGRLFPAGTGCVIEPGMEPGKNIPEDNGMKSYVLQGIDNIAQKGVEAGAYPGCRVLVWKNGQTVYDKSFGTRSDKDATPVGSSHLFDLAALTNTTATLLAVMKLYDDGRIRLDDKVSAYLPFLNNGDKRRITIRELLFHESGLPSYIRFYQELIDPNSVHGPYMQSWADRWHRTRVSEHSYYSSDFKFKKGMVSGKQTSTHSLHMADGLWLNKSFKHAVLQQIAKCELEPNRYIYSDLGFVLLQQLVETRTGMSMDAYLEKEFYGPMGLNRTVFLPLKRFAKEEIMPTASDDFLRRQDLCGYVHDETAACLGGVSGSGGLFSTAEEVAKIYQMLLNGGEIDGRRFLGESVCHLFTKEKSAVREAKR